MPEHKLPRGWSWDGTKDGRLWLIQTLGSGWFAHFELVPSDDGGLRFAEICLRPASWWDRRRRSQLPGDLTAPIQRRLSPTKAASLAHLVAAEAADWIEKLKGVDAKLAERWANALETRNLVAAAHGQRLRAGSPSDDGFLAQLAADYVAVVASGAGRYRAVLAKRYGRNEDRIRDLLIECRNRGLLTRSAPGKAGGELTAKAKEILGMPAAKSKSKSRAKGAGK